MDTYIWDLVQHESERQRTCCELIASENFVSGEVMQALGTCLTNKYSEGYPGKRYYGGNEFIDEIESECCARALATFHLDNNGWGVNVQPLSGCTANLAAYSALLQPGDKIMGLALTCGGHLSHGFRTADKKVSVTSVYYESHQYGVDAETGLLDYDAIEALATTVLPKALIAGASAYSRDWDYARMRQIADKVGAYLYVDMAHIAGLVAAGEHNSPFLYADIVTTTTHKTLRGPRSGMIFFRKKYEKQVNDAVFPGMFGGPHNHQIAALAIALREAQSDDFVSYIKNVKNNARILCLELQRLGFDIVTGGTENHIVLVNLQKSRGITGSKMELVCEAVNITLNKNTVPGDKSAFNPSGIRLGTAAMTTRGFTADNFIQVARWLNEAADIAVVLQQEYGVKLEDFRRGLAESLLVRDRLRELREQVIFVCSNAYYPSDK